MPQSYAHITSHLTYKIQFHCHKKHTRNNILCQIIKYRMPIFLPTLCIGHKNIKQHYEGVRGARQNTTVFYPIYYADDNMFRPLWAFFMSQKCIKRKTIQRVIVSRGLYSALSTRSRCRLVYPY